MKRVLIVEDIAEAQRWLSAIVAEVFPQVHIVTADTIRAAQPLLQQPLDLALIELGLPDGSGLSILRSIREFNAAVTCLVTTVMGDDASIVAALAAGADGYLLKETPPDVLRHQLGQLSVGVPALSPAVARRIMDHFRQTGPAAAAEGQLTQREAQVLALIARGLRNAEVAAQLGIAETTVAGYIKIVYRKLGIGSRAEAAWHASRMGLTTDPDRSR